MQPTNKAAKSIYLMLATTAVLGATNPAWSQSTPANANILALNELKGVPTKITLKKLDKKWSRFILDSKQQDDPMLSRYLGGMMNNTIMRDLLAEQGIGVYYTQGHTVRLGDETFLVAYRINTGENQDAKTVFRSMFAHGPSPRRSTQGRFAADTPLVLSLLNMRTAGSLDSVRSFDTATDILSPRDVIQVSMENLQAIGTALKQITPYQEHTNGLPLRSAAEAGRNLIRFAHLNAGVLNEPRTGRPYATNRMLAGKRTAKLRNAGQLIAFYEQAPGTDGKRGVLYLDGKTDRLPAWKFAAAIKTMPAKPTIQEVRAETLNELKILAYGLNRYSRYAGTLPKGTPAYRALSYFYMYSGRDESAERYNRRQSQTFNVNSAILAKKLKDVTNGAEVIAIYEIRKDTDGRRAVAFLNGRVERVDEARFQRVLKKPVVLKTVPKTTKKSRA